jgi:hypothetical protein
MNDMRPSVRKLIGNVRIRNIVPIVAFARAINIPARIALKNPLTVTPGIRKAATDTATPISRISIINLIFYKFRVVGLILISVINIVIACQSPAKKTDALEAIKIELNPDSSKIVLKGLSNNIAESLKTDSLKLNAWQNLFAVYSSISADKNSISEPIMGTYVIGTDNSIIFSPDSAFVKGHIYYARFYYPQYYQAGNVLEHRSLPGTVAFKEERFKF